MTRRSPSRSSAQRRRTYRNSVALLALLVGGAAQAQIVADGKTATTVSQGAGAITDIRTGTIAAGHGVNSFSSFSTTTGSVTNIHVPSGAKGTVNIVNGPRSVINGAVNSVAGGTIGGDLYFANPAGVVVGPDGGFHGGSVSLSTPSQDFVKDMFAASGQVGGEQVSALITGNAPTGQGDIVIHGQVRGERRVRMQAGGDVVIGGDVAALGPEGSVAISAGRDVHLAPGGAVTARDGASGGHVTLRAGRDVRVATGAVILAEGEGAGHGGTIDVFASHAAILDLGGRVSVAAHGAGDGGFVEFSAEKSVEVHGLLQAWSAEGAGGTVYIDPENITITGAIENGADFIAEATARIIVASGAVISTRKVDAEPSDHATAKSQGDSGDIVLTAPNIEIRAQAQLLAHADEGFESGDIVLRAERIDAEGHLTEALPVSSTSVEINNAYLHARNIKISAETVKNNTVDAEENINAYLGGLIPDGLPGDLTSQLVALGEQAASKSQAILDAANYDNWPSYLEARATIGIDRSVLRAEEQIRIASFAGTKTEITPETGGMALVIAASNTRARTIVTDSLLIGGDAVSVVSGTRADQALRAEGVPGGGLSGLNTALVASVRMGGAETVLSGTSWNAFTPAGVDLIKSMVVKAGGPVVIEATNRTELDLMADTRLGENGRGASIVLSLDDREAVTAVGGAIWSNTLDVEILARNIYETVNIHARVTGGALEAEDAPDSAQDGQPEATQDIGAGVLDSVAAEAQKASALGDGAGITAATSGGDPADRAYAASFALSNHAARAEVLAGTTNISVVKPGGGSHTIGDLAVRELPEEVFMSPGGDRRPSIEVDTAPADEGVRLTAENILGNVRQSAITAAGEVPEPGEEPDVAAKSTALLSVSLADWDLDATVTVGDADSGWSELTSPAGITITARNAARDFAGREALDDAHELYSGKRQAEDPSDDEGSEAVADPEGFKSAGEAVLEPDDEGSDEDETGDGDGEGDETGEGDEDEPNPGGLIGAWSDGEGALFARDDGSNQALSVAQTFAAGEKLGAGLSLARLTGDQRAQVVVTGSTGFDTSPMAINLPPESGIPLGAVTVQALQAGVWGASSGAPDTATSASEGGAYGASISLVNIEALTSSVIQNGPSFYAEDNDAGVTVLAQDTRLVSADARTHGTAGKTAFSGAFSMVQRDDMTQAFVAPRNYIEIDGALRVRALNSGDTVTVVSAGAVGQRSIGIGIALTFADRETRAGLVGEDIVDLGDKWAEGIAVLGGLEVTATNDGNVISGGRTRAGEASDAMEPPEETDPEETDLDAAEADDEAPVSLDAEAIGAEDSGRIAEAVGGANPLEAGGGDGSGNEEEGGLAFAGDFGGLFGTVTTEALVVGRDRDPDNQTDAIYVDVEGAVDVSSATTINYGQSSAVTAVATGGVGISGSFGLTSINHQTATRLVDSEIQFGTHYHGDEVELNPVRITSTDESRLDFLVDGRAGRPDGGWAMAIAANFTKVSSTVRTELQQGFIRLGDGTGPHDLASDDLGDFDEGFEGEFDEGSEGDLIEGPPCDGLFCGPVDARPPSADGREIIVSALSDPTLTIRATSERSGPGDETPVDPTPTDDPDVPEEPATEADTADATQMDAVGDLIRDSGEAAQKKDDEKEDEGAGGGNNEGEGGLKGISITVAPLRFISDASVVLENSLLEAQLLRENPDATGPEDAFFEGNPGQVTVRSTARTSLDIDASSDAIAAAIAITDTKSRVRVSRSDIDVRGNGTLTMLSEADEQHRMRATAGAARAIKAAGILSLRSMENRLLIDADESRVPSWRDNGETMPNSRFIIGAGTEIAGRSTHDLDFEVIAGDGSTAALALAGIISLADTVTELGAGVILLNDQGLAVLEATNTYTRYSARAIAAAGSLVPGAEEPQAPGEDEDAPEADDEATGDGSGSEDGEGAEDDNPMRRPRRVGKAATALMDVADDTEDAVSDDTTPPEEDGGEGDETPAPKKESASRKASFAIAFTLDRHDDVTTARGAAPRLLPDDAALIIGGFRADGWTGAEAPSVSLHAGTHIESFLKEARAGIGLGEAAPQRGAVVAVNLGDWRIATDAMVGAHVLSVEAGQFEVSATTTLPDVAVDFDREAWLANEDSLFERGAGGYAEGEDLPGSAASLVDDESWNIISSAQSDFGKLGVAVDGSITRVRSNTSAAIASGRLPMVSGSLNVSAETSGGLATRRDPEGLVPVESGGFGAGGSGHILLLRPTTTALIDATPASSSDKSELGEITISARNALVGAAAAASFGKAETFGLNIGFAMVDYDGAAIARLVRPEQVQSVSAAVLSSDESVLLADAGSQTGGNIAVGVSVALIFGDRAATAEILGGLNSDATLNLGGAKVEAVIEGASIATSQAGAGKDDAEDAETEDDTTPPDGDTPGDGVASENEPETRERTEVPTKLLGMRAETNADDLADKEVDTQDDKTEGQGGKSEADGAKFGFALAGDFSGLFGRSDAVARIEHAGGMNIVQDANGLVPVQVTSRNDLALFGGAGATVSGAGSFGLAASVALNGTRRSTTSELTLRALDIDEGIVLVNALDRSEVRLLAAGRAGAGVDFSVAGSAALDYARTDVAATVDVGALTWDDEAERGLEVFAGNRSTSVTLAGAVRPASETDEDEESEDESGGIGIGVAFAGQFAPETVTATLSGSVSTPGAVSVRAERTGRVDALASSSGVAGSFSLAAAAAVAAVDREVSARVDNASVFAGASVTLEAIDETPTRLRVGSESESDGISAGAAGVIAVEDRRTRAVIDGSSVYGHGASAPDVIVRARQASDVDAVQTGAGESEDGFSATIGLGVLFSDRTTRAEIIESHVADGDVSIEAAQAGNLHNRQGVVNAPNIGGSLGVIVTRLTSDVAARSENSVLAANVGAVSISATEQSSLLSRAAKTGKGGSSIDVMVATATLRGTLAAEAVGGTIASGNLAIRAEENSRLAAAAIARASTDGVGGTGGVGYAANRLDVTARLAAGADALAGGATVQALATSAMSGTVVGVNMGGGTFAGSIQVAWLTANRYVRALAELEDVQLVGDLTVEARREDKQVGIGATAQEAGASVGIAGNILQTGGRTLAEARIAGDVDIAGDLEVAAHDASKAVNVAVGTASGSGGFSAVGSLAYVQMGRLPAGAQPAAVNARSADHETAIEGVRDDLGDEMAGVAGLEASELRRRFDLAIEARVAIEDASALTVGGATGILATDARRVAAIAGQLQVNFSTGGVVEKALDVVSIDENGVSVSIRDVASAAMTELVSIYLGSGGGGDDENDAGISEAGAEAAAREGEAPAPDGGPDIGDDNGGDGDGGSGGVSVGASMGWARLGGLVAADLVLGAGAGAALGDLTIDASSEARAAGVSVGAMAGGTNLGAGAGISRHDQLVRAGMTGVGNSIAAGRVAMDAASDGRSWAIAGQLAVGDSGAQVGGTLAVSDIDAQTLTRISGVTLDTSAAAANHIELHSSDTSSSLAMALTGGVSAGGSAVSLSVGVNTANSLTRAIVENATLRAGGNVIIAADRAQSLNSFVLQVAVGGSGAGVGASLSVAQQKGRSDALVLDSEIETGRNLVVAGTGASSMGSAAVGVAAGGSAGVSGSVAISLKEDAVNARIEGSDVSAGDTVLVRALNGGEMGSAGGGDDSVLGQLGAGNFNIAVGGSAGIGVSVAVVKSAATIRSEIVGSTLRARLSAPSGIGAGVDTIRRSASSDDWFTRGSANRQGVIVEADNETRLRAANVTLSAAGTVAVSALVPVILQRDDVAARIEDSNVEAGDADATVQAFNASGIRTVSVVGAFSGGAGVGALVEVASLKKKTRAEIVDSDVKAGGDVDVVAASPERLNKYSLAAGGGGFAGVAGLVETLVTENETLALVDRSRIIAGRDIGVETAAPRQINHTGATVAVGGVAGIAGTVMVINARDTGFAGTTDDFSAGGASTLLAGRDLTVRASSTLSVGTTLASGSGAGAVAIGGQVLVTSFSQSVIAQIGDGTVLNEDGAGLPRDVTIEALQAFDQTITLGSVVAGGAAAIGGSVGVTNMRNTVSARLGRGIDLSLTRDFTILAEGVRDLDATAVAGAAAGAFAMQGSVLVATFAGSTADPDSDGYMDRVGDDMRGDPFTARVDDDTDYDGSGRMDLGDSQLGGIFAEARGDRQSVDFEALRRTAQSDVIETRIGVGTRIAAGGMVDIGAREGGDVRMLTGAVAVAAVGVSAGVSVLRRYSNVQVNIDGNVAINGQTVFIGARAETDDGNVNAVAGGAALLGSGSAAVARTQVERRVQTRLFDGVAISSGLGLTSITASEVGASTARTITANVGAVAIGLATANSSRSSTVTLDLGNVSVSGGSLNLRAFRSGDTSTSAIAASGGIASGSGSLSLARDLSEVTVTMDGADLTGLDEINIGAMNTGTTEAGAFGVNVGAATAGLSSATAEREAVSRIAGRAELRGGSASVISSDAGGLIPGNAALVKATGEGSNGGALFGAGAVFTKVKNTATSEVDLRLGAVNLDGDLLADARSNTRLEAFGNGNTASLGLALGYVKTQADNRLTNHTHLRLDTGMTVGGRADILATSRGDTKSAAISGIGGGVTVQASESTLHLRPDSEVSVQGGAISALGGVRIATDRALGYQNLGDARAASLANYSGVRLDTEIDARLHTALNADITAPSIEVLGLQSIVPVSGDFNARAKVGSVVSGSSIETDFFMRLDARVEVAPNVALRQLTGRYLGGSGVRVGLLQNLVLQDRATQLNRGVYNRPGADLGGTLELAQSAVRLDSVLVEAEDDIVVFNRADMTATTEAVVSNTSTAGNVNALTYTRLTGEQATSILGNTRLTSTRGNVRLWTGRDETRRQIVQLNAESRLIRKSGLVAFRDTQALVRSEFDASMTVDSGVRAIAGRDVSLSGDRGLTNFNGFWQQLKAKGSPDGDALFEDVTIVESGGGALDLGRGRMHMDGRATAGAFGSVVVTVAGDGSVQAEGDVEEPSVRIVENQLRNAALVSFIAQQKAALAQLKKFGDWQDQAQITRLEAEVASLEARLERLGGADARGDVVVVDPLFAQGGNIDMRTDTITGNGVIRAKGDAEIRVTNESAMTMEVRGGQIPFRDVGRISMNGIDVADTQALRAATKDSTATILLESTLAAGTEPMIRLRGTHVALDGPPADLVVSGDIENLAGTIEVTSLDGSVLVLGAEIAGKSVLVNSGGDFFLSGAAEVTSPARNPEGVYRSFFETYENMGPIQYQNYRAGLLPAGLEPFSVDRSAQGRIRALGGVHIFADVLNIDGTIQSGETDWRLDVAASFADRLRLLTEAEIGGRDRILVYDAFNTGDQLGKELSPELVVLPGLGSAYRPYVTGNASVWFNVEDGTLEVEPMLTKGGYIELVGRMASTGGHAGPEGRAQLIAANGYGHITVDNHSDMPIVFNGLSTSAEPITGEIRITDLNDVSLQTALVNGFILEALGDRYPTTVYRKSGNFVEVTREVLDYELNLQPQGTVVPSASFFVEEEVSLVAPDAARFDPASQMAFEILRAKIGSSDEAQFDLITPLSFSQAGLDADTPYLYRREFVTDDDTGVTWRVHSHRLAANRPIDIRFAGQNNGAIEITSVGDVRLAAGVYNRSGATSITSLGALGGGTAGNAPLGGNLVTLGDGVQIVAADLTLRAEAGDILGASYNSFSRTVGATNWGQLIRTGDTTRETTGVALIDLADGAILSAEATGDIFLREVTGDMVLGSVAGARVSLEAPGAILSGGAGVNLAGDRVELTAQHGGIGTSVRPLAVSSAWLDARAGQDIHLTVPTGNLGIGQIAAPGRDVHISVAQGSIFDANPDDGLDLRAEAGLVDVLWNELGLFDNGSDGAEARIAGLAQSEAAADRTDYFFYWGLRAIDKGRDETGAWIYDDLGYDPGFAFSYQPELRAALLGEGFSEAEIADRETERTEAYHRIHALYGDEPYDPDRDLAPEGDRLAALTEDLFLLETQLQRLVRRNLVEPLTDGEIRPEAANIVARDLYLDAAFDIGRAFEPVNLAPGDETPDGALAALWQAERTHITEEADGSITLRGFDDLDVDLSGDLVAGAAQRVIVGTDGDLRVALVEGGAEVRLSAGASIIDAAPGREIARISGNEILLEARAGGIGGASAPLSVATTGAGAALGGSAPEGIWLTGPGDLTLGALQTPGPLLITLPKGALRARAGLDRPHLTGGEVTLSALTGIGLGGTGLVAPMIAPDSGANLTVSLDTEGDIAFDIADGASIVATGLAAPMGNVTVGGPGTFTFIEDMLARGNIILRPGALNLGEYVLETVSGELELDLPGAFVLGERARLATNGGDLSLSLGGDFTLLGQIDAGTGVIEFEIGGAVTGAGVLPQITAEKLVLNAGGEVSGSVGRGLRTAVGSVEARVERGAFALVNEGALSLGALVLNEGRSAQVISTGAMTLDGSVTLDHPETTLLVLASGGTIAGRALLRADRAVLYAEGAIGADGAPLELDLSEVQAMDIAARDGALVIDVLRGEPAFGLVTAAAGSVGMTAPGEIVMDTVGSIEEPLLDAVGGATLGQWGDEPADIAGVIGFAGLVEAGFFQETDVPGPSDDKGPGDGDTGDDGGDAGGGSDGGDDGSGGDDGGTGGDDGGGGNTGDGDDGGSDDADDGETGDGGTRPDESGPGRGGPDNAWNSRDQKGPPTDLRGSLGTLFDRIFGGRFDEFRRGIGLGSGRDGAREREDERERQERG
ncbi:leukotoxin LktA family filamentous adhesin [Sinisalibacter lacisalsi]|uniref:Filamentous haemagglutinin FhaB/tRNA nuclease CdiA-like TPS domain-containing protein n=1 Tax=Sinisalibacter lacisalsi TaxID=1526570 RepID=A0ABQ1QMB9_9RHOB|nr:leukotoxin LktA family filamentous adhesin [Sinisalibacter lacisalsi]GGD36176.1 hypothetical protein GCM10011358_19980 [Sinisalibacter lacisalsi]